MIRRTPVTLTLALIALTAAWPGSSDARSFRELSPIPTPGALPEGARRVERIDPVDRELVARGVRAILSAWNEGRLRGLLADTFVNRQKLADTLLTVVPRDATLELLSLRSFSTLQQFRTEDTDRGAYRVSRVAAVVRMQVLFNDPLTGYQRLPNTSELILEIREPVP